MGSHRSRPPSEELELLSHIGDYLADHCSELAAEWQKTLESVSLYHERLFTHEELSQISQITIRELVEAVQSGEMYSAQEAVRERGAHFAHLGLGEKPLVECVCAWQDLCLPLVLKAYQDGSREQSLLVVTKALSQYAALFAEGFLEANRERILDAQDEMIIALEQSLRESEQLLAVTLKSIGDGVIATDTKGIVTFINAVAEFLTGWSQKEAVGRPLAEVFYIISEETRVKCENPFEKIVKTGRIMGLANSTILVAKNGVERQIADSGAPIRDESGTILGTVLVFRDVSERRKMEEDIIRLRTEKMESISVLAGGIAHDFNNILTAILGNITIAKMHSESEGKVFKLLTEAEKASLMAKNLTQQLLTFSKGGAPIRKPASIKDLLKTTAEFALSGSKAQCEFRISPDLWSVDIDAGQISQVINNLIINADQAMPAGGIILVSTENVQIEEENEINLKEGNYIRISVVDEGIGIPEAHLQRIFEPYFTTKQKGSGLGLATSFSIVRNHDGCITVDSDLGEGTRFCVYLPVSEQEVVMEVREPCKRAKGKGRVLLMDDEESILEVTGEVLQYLGYTVETARDGEEAVELYKKAQEKRSPFDVVIVDLTIRGKMGGREAIHALLQVDPEVKAIVSSGYCDDPVMANYREYGFSGVVTKPYTIEELSEVLQKVLGTSS